MKSLKKTTVATFGVALSGLYLAPTAEADIVDLTSSLPSPSSNGFQVVNLVAASDVNVFNMINLRSLVVGPGALTGLRSTNAGNSLTTGMSFIGGLPLSTASSGTFTIGFKTASNQVGWLRMHFNVGSGTQISYLAAAYNDTPGAGITVGAVPEPGTFGLVGLAALALGVGRRRKNVELA